MILSVMLDRKDMEATKSIMRYACLIICLLSNTYGYGQAPNWNINAEDFQYSMNITGAYFSNCQFAGNLQDTVAAFVEGELRGVAPVSEVVNQVSISYMTLFSNEPSGETVSFRFYSKASNAVTSLSVTAEFLEGKILGGRSTPFQLYQEEPQIVPPVIEVENDSIFVIAIDPHYGTYRWYGDGQLLNGENDPFLKFVSSGSYTAEVITMAGCRINSNSVVVEIGGDEGDEGDDESDDEGEDESDDEGEDESDDEIIVTGLDHETLREVQIYPVPFHDSFYLTFPIQAPGNYTLMIHDLDGKQILAKQLEGTQLVHGIAGLSHIPNGIYSLQLMRGNIIKSYRVLKY